MADGAGRRDEARREAREERSEANEAMTPGERMERAYRLFELTRGDG